MDRPFSNQQGERETDFIDIVTWRRLAEVCANNLGKGRLVGVEGRLQVREYEYEGQRRRQAEVVADNVQFLDWPKDGSGPGPAAGGDLAATGWMTTSTLTTFPSDAHLGHRKGGIAHWRETAAEAAARCAPSAWIKSSTSITKRLAGFAVT